MRRTWRHTVCHSSGHTAHGHGHGTQLAPNIQTRTHAFPCLYTPHTPHTPPTSCISSGPSAHMSSSSAWWPPSTTPPRRTSSSSAWGARSGGGGGRGFSKFRVQGPGNQIRVSRVTRSEVWCVSGADWVKHGMQAGRRGATPPTHTAPHPHPTNPAHLARPCHPSPVPPPSPHPQVPPAPPAPPAPTGPHPHPPPAGVHMGRSCWWW